MPYTIAHPLAVIPLARLMGRHAVPSALAIGSVVPDLWYLVPGVDRAFTHAASGLLLFCLPAGLAAYLAFHRLLKEPLLHLLPPGIAARARAFVCAGLPRASWVVVSASLILGAATHQAWDGLTHPGPLSSRLLPFLGSEVLGVELHRVLQHASTLVGSAALTWWTWAKLKAAPKIAGDVLPSRPRQVVAAGVAAFGAMAFGAMLLLALPEVELRDSLRAAAVTGASALGVAVLLYALAFRLRR